MRSGVWPSNDNLGNRAAASFLIAIGSVGPFRLVWIYGNELHDPRYLDGWMLAGGMSVQLYFHIAIKRASLSPKSVIRWQKIHIATGYLRCDRLTPGAFLKPLELGIQRGQHVVGDRLDHAQRVFRRHLLLNVDVGEQRPRSGIRSAHASPLDVVPERNHIGPSLSAGEKFNSLLGAFMLREARGNQSSNNLIFVTITCRQARLDASPIGGIAVLAHLPFALEPRNLHANAHDAFELGSDEFRWCIGYGPTIAHRLLVQICQPGNDV